MKLLTLTYLIFEVNAAIDTGRHQDITPDEIREKALDGNVIPFIKDKLGDDIDLSLFFDPKTLGELRDTLKVVAGTLHGRERRKVGVERSGLCLLVAYAVEAIQRQSKIGWEPTA